MKEIYKSGKMVRYETDKGNKVEVYKERIGGKTFWFVAFITKNEIINANKDFDYKKDAIAYAKLMASKYY